MESQRLRLRLEVARDGINRSEVPKSAVYKAERWRRLVGVLFELLPKLLLGLSLEKLLYPYVPGDRCKGLVIEKLNGSVVIVGVTIGVGRKMDVSLSLVTEGGGTTRGNSDIALVGVVVDTGEG